MSSNTPPPECANRPSRLKNVNGFFVLDSPTVRQAVHFSLEDIKQAEDNMDREDVERSLSSEVP
jgi:hypothetical protein